MSEETSCRVDERYELADAADWNGGKTFLTVTCQSFSCAGSSGYYAWVGKKKQKFWCKRLEKGKKKKKTKLSPMWKKRHRRSIRDTQVCRHQNDKTLVRELKFKISISCLLRANALKMPQWLWELLLHLSHLGSTFKGDFQQHDEDFTYFKNPPSAADKGAFNGPKGENLRLAKCKTLESNQGHTHCWRAAGSY